MIQKAGFGERAAADVGRDGAGHRPEGRKEGGRKRSFGSGQPRKQGRAS